MRGRLFLIYAAASARGTDGDNLLGIHRVGLADSEWVARPAAEAALIEESLQMPVRDFLTENEVPSDLVDELFKHLSTEVYWLTEHDEEMLGVKSAAFQKFLAKNCAWDDALEKAVLRGERLEEMKTLSACRIRVTLPAAHKALAQALKEKALDEKAPDGKAPDIKAPDTRAPDTKARAGKPTEPKGLGNQATAPKPRPGSSESARTSGQTSAVAP